MAETVTYETLREIQRSERKSEKLYELTDSFYSSVASYLEKRSGAMDNMSQTEVMNAKCILKDILDRRERKILNQAMRSARANEKADLASMTSSEKSMFNSVIGVLEKYRDQLSQFPDVLPVLSSLRRKYSLIVATGTAREFLPYLLDGLDGHFVRIFSSISDYDQLKSPQFYSKVCQEMGVKPHEMVHIGDSKRFDFMAAKEVGISVIHLNRNQESDKGGSLQRLTDLKARL